MLAVWCEKLGVCEGFERQLRLKGERKIMYMHYSKPNAAAAIEKGRNLTAEEFQVCVY